MQTALPFDAGAGSNVTEDGWAKMAALWRRTGVIAGALNKLAVTANGAGMQVTVDTGQAWINGFYYENDAALVVPIGPADPVNPRIDRVVARLDRGANTIAIVVIAGAPAPVPAAPALQAGNVVFDVPLAQVRVDAAAVSITAPKVTDERLFSPQNADDEGLLANRGTAFHGRYFWATDDRGGRLWRGDGAAWYDLGPGPVTGPQTGSTALIVGHPSASTADTVLSIRGKVGQSGDIFKASDPTGATNFLRLSSAGELISQGAATASVYGARSTGDTADRFAVRGDGRVQWADGTLAADLIAARASAGRLNITGTVQIQNADTGGAPLSFGTLVLQQAIGQTGKLFTLRDSSSGNQLQMDELGTILAGNGTNAAPSYAFINTAGMGMYRQAASVLGFRVPAAGSWSFRNSADAQVAKIDDTGTITAIGTDHFLGGNALGATGAMLHITTDGLGAYARINSKGSPADVGMVLNTKGAGALVLQNDAATIAQLSNVGSFAAISTDSYFGAYALGAAGARVRLNSTSTTDAGVFAESSAANASLNLRQKGTGLFRFQTSAAVALATLDSTGVLSNSKDAYLGSYGLATGTGSRLHVSDDTAWVYLAAEGASATLGMWFKTKGTGGGSGFSFNNDAATTYLSIVAATATMLNSETSLHVAWKDAAGVFSGGSPIKVGAAATGPGGVGRALYI